MRDGTVTLHGEANRRSIEAIAPALAAALETVDNRAALDWLASLNGDWVGAEIALMKRRCEELAPVANGEIAYRAAATLLIARLREIREWYREAQRPPDAVDPPSVRRHAGPWQLVVDQNTPVPGPVRLDDGTVIDEVHRFIGRLLTAADFVISKRGISQESGGAALITIYRQQLAACGVIVHMEPVA